MIEQVLFDFIGTLLLNIFCVYCWFNLLDKSVKWKSIKIWLVIVFMAIIGVTLNNLCPQPYKIIVSFIFLTIVSYYVVARSFGTAVILMLISQVIIMISELTFGFIALILFNGNVDKFAPTTNISMISNVYVAIVSLFLLKTKLPSKLFSSFISIANIIKKREVLAYSAMICAVIIVSTMESYMNIPKNVILITNTTMALVFIFMVGKFASAKDKYYKMNSKYQTSISSLNEYGEMLDKYRVVTHENKNQLLTIQKMSREENVIKYIGTLIDEKIKDNERVMNKTFKIPDGGFRSIIYAKLCKIDELKIKYKLDISNDIKTVDLIDMDEMSVKDVCTILGVYLDNAIDAVKNLKKKNIFIEIYVLDNFLCFDITNNFEGVIDIDKLKKSRYTTKGDGHGYGLTLVNKIDAENKEIETECEISSNMITQRVKMKM